MLYTMALPLWSRTSGLMALQVCDVASAADLPHSGDSGFDGDSGSVVKLILFQLVGEDGAGSHKAHGSSLCQLRNNFFSKISHKAQYYQLTLKISTKKEPLISQKSQILRFYKYCFLFLYFQLYII